MTRLGIVRRRLGITQEQMARLLGVTNTSIWRWEQDVGELSPWHHAILDAFERACERQPSIGSVAIHTLTTDGVAKALFYILHAAFGKLG